MTEDQQPLTKDSTRAKRRENAKRKDRRRPLAKASAPAFRAYKRPAPGSITNSLTKED
jgi:hypothetical protein